MTVEAGVLETLRHDGRGVLLKLRDEANHVPSDRIGSRSAQEITGEDLLDPMKQARFGIGASFAPPLYGSLDLSPVVWMGVERTHVGAVHGEAGDDLLQRFLDAGQGEVPRAPVRLRDAVELVRQDLKLASQQEAHRVLLAGVEDVVERSASIRKALVDSNQRTLSGGIDQQPVHQVQELVAGGSVDGPVRSELLVDCENLLHDQVETPVQEALTNPLAVGSRVGKTIDVIDPQAVHLTPLDPLEDALVCELEEILPIHPEPGELVDVEEAAVVDLVRCDAPVGEAVVLRFEQSVERLEAPPVPRAPVDLADHLFDVSGDRIGLARDQGCESGLRLLGLPGEASPGGGPERPAGRARGRPGARREDRPSPGRPGTRAARASPDASPEPAGSSVA